MRRLLFVVLVSMMFANNLYAKGGKGSVSKGSFSSKSATTQQKKTDTPTQSAPAQSPAASNSNAAPAPNAPAQTPSLLQSVMPALVGGAAGSYIGSKLADDGNNEKPAVENGEKKEEQFLKP